MVPEIARAINDISQPCCATLLLEEPISIRPGKTTEEETLAEAKGRKRGGQQGRHYFVKRRFEPATG